MIFSPSVACADQLYLADQVAELLSLGMDRLHFDVMDGHYVPNLCFSLDVGKQLLAKFPEVKLDVHLMVTDPMAYVDALADMGAERVAFHLSATPFALRTLAAIRAKGMKAGIVLNPSEPVAMLEPVLDAVDFVVLMSIEPGFAGQKFMENTYERTKELADMRRQTQLDFEISIDGGVSPLVGKQLLECGADILILGYLFIFGQPDGMTSAWKRGRLEMKS